jgi:O-antigen ligase
MTPRPAGHPAGRDAAHRAAHRAALACLLILPAFLMHGRAVAEILIAAIDLIFLGVCIADRDATWLRHAWPRIALAWWGWLVLCSFPGIGIGGWLSFGHALADLRFLVLVAALGHWLLVPAAARRWLGRVLTACALYIGLSAWLQLATGRDLMGYPRNVSGELTGPFLHPRAGAPLSILLFPTLLPWLSRIRALPAGLLAAVSVGTIVLIGQRMPLLLTLLGLFVCGLLLRRLRGPMLAALAAGAVVLAASAVISPPTWGRLVVKFSAQMGDFPDSQYGLIFRRALVIAEAHPVFGQGFAGYRNACPDPRYFSGWPGDARYPDGGGASSCNIHPHNHYLEALTDAGVPGLILFCAMVLAWWRALLRGLARDPRPLRVGLFVACLLQEWPLASASSFTAMEIGGFFFVLLGWGLAEAAAAQAEPT